MAKVIISSTGLDLQAYRAAAVDTCMKLGVLPIAMEFFEAMGVGATVGSREQMKDADVYVGVYAHRYGYVEDGYDASVTELEFDYAGQLQIERLCFLVDNAYPWPPDAVDHARYDRLEAFKQRLGKTVIYDEFTTVDDFTAKLMHALVRWSQRNPGQQGDTSSERSLGDAGETRSPIPPMPSLPVGREDDLKAIKGRLGLDGQQARPVIVVRGWPGVGKTTFVAALANDPEVASAFPDGVLWASLGEQPNTFSALCTWALALGVGGPGSTVEEVRERLRATLHDRRCLLLVDDVWETGAGLALRVGGPHCVTVYTTRFPAVARELGVQSDEVQVLGQLDEPGALKLLTNLAPNVVEQSPDASRQLVNALEGLPLAIRVAGRLLEAELRMGWGITDLVEEITEGAALLDAMAPEDRFDPATQTIPTVSMLLQRSTDRLDDQTRERFAYLGVFAPKPATFDLAAMQSVWMVDDGRATARQLADRGLLEPIIGTGRFQIHAVLVLHAKSLLA